MDREPGFAGISTTFCMFEEAPLQNKSIIFEKIFGEETCFRSPPHKVQAWATLFF